MKYCVCYNLNGFINGVDKYDSYKEAFKNMLLTWIKYKLDGYKVKIYIEKE